MRTVLTASLAALAIVVLSSPAAAQPLGTFTWQLQPYCNLVSVTVVQSGSTYTLDGFDNQCGAAQRVPVVGAASLNPDGTVELGMNLVVATGLPVHITARVMLPSASGTWQDSLGQTGAFVLGGNAAGSPRPVPTTLLSDGAVTTAKLADDAVTGAKIAPGAVGASDIDSTEVQRRISTACPAGQLMTAVTADGTVLCEAPAVGSGDITSVAAGTGLAGGGTSGDITLSVAPEGITSALLAADSVDTSKIAASAVGLADINTTEVQRRVGGTCTAGSAVRVVNEDGTVTCESISSAGDITSVTAGAGLTGGGVAGDVSLAVAFGGSGSAASSAHSDHTHGIATDNTAIGATALGALTTGINNTALGSATLAANTSGDDNSAGGFRALNANTTGVLNTAFGVDALVLNDGGSENTAIGALALGQNTVGDGNTAVGRNALLENLSGENNIALGYSAGGGLTTGSQNVYIQAPAGSAAEANTLRIGSTITRAFVGGIRGVTTDVADAIAVMIDSNGQLSTISSSRRTKDNIHDLGDVSREILNLRPVQFTYKQTFADGSAPVQYGLIAEEVAEVLPELVAHNKDGEIETVKYHLLPTLLLAEVQRLERERAALAHDRDDLAARVAALERMVNTLTAQLGQR